MERQMGWKILFRLKICTSLLLSITIRPAKFSIFTGICLFLFQNYSYSTERYTLLTEDFPPLNFLENGQATGPSVDVVKLIIKRLNIEAEIFVHPWIRSYKKALTTPYHAVFSTSRIRERENLFQWVGPLAEKKFCFYARPDFKHRIKSILDAKPFRVGVQRGSAASSTLESLGFDNLQSVSTPRQNLGKLMRNRFDLWFVSNAAVAEALKATEAGPHTLKEVFVYQTLQQYIAFNIKTPVSAIQAWQSELDRIIRSKEYHSIFKKHGSSLLIPVAYRE